MKFLTKLDNLGQMNDPCQFYQGKITNLAVVALEIARFEKKYFQHFNKTMHFTVEEDHYRKF